MKEWSIPVCWQVCGIVNVEADTLERAMEIARDAEGVLPLPGESDYVYGSWELSHDDADEIRRLYNDNQQDERGG
jgi:hypothetical protein